MGKDPVVALRKRSDQQSFGCHERKEQLQQCDLVCLEITWHQ